MTQNVLKKITSDDINKYVKKRYKRVFSKELLERYVKDYIGFISAEFLFQNRVSYYLNLNQKILDIGSGAGSFVCYLRQKGFQAYGIEINKFESDFSVQRLEELGINKNSFPIFTHGSALSLPYPDETFDIITFWDVLEHIQDYQLALKEAKRVLKPSGKIFILAPNYCAFRQEAHYHVPWFPFMTRKIARTYLKLLGKDPWFYDEGVFHITNFGVIKNLRKLGLKAYHPVHMKINNRYDFKVTWFATMLNIFIKLKLLRPLLFMIKIIQLNPFKQVIDLIAVKSEEL